jgi:hypothetical protein
MRLGWMSISGVLVVGALIAAPLLSSHQDTVGMHRSGRFLLARPVVVGGAPAARHASASDEQHRPVRPAPRSAQRAAASFLGAYLAYEVGRAGRSQLETLHGRSSRALWHELNANRGEPKPPRAVAEDRLAALVPGLSARRDVVALLATLRGRGSRSGLVVVLKHHGPAWRVVKVGR